jgi:alpha-1,2-mannosyltransferase
LLVLIVAVAAVVRARPLVELDRFGLMAYDQAAYFVGARALTRGHLPYVDYVHIQPPGVLLALAPFSLIGSWGFTFAKLLVVAVGAASTALVWRIARAGSGALAALLAGFVYASSRPSVGAHRYLLIEPFVTLVLLAAIALYVRTSSPTRPGPVTTAVGLLLGSAVAFKLSAGVVVAAFTLAVAVVTRSREALLRIARGIGIGAVVVFGPFLLIAGTSAVRQMVWTQAGRDRSVTVLNRLLSTFWFAGSPPAQHRSVALAGVLVVIAVLVAWVWRSRTFVAVLSAVWLALGTGFVLATPQFFEHHGELVAAPVAMLVGGLVASLPRVARVAAVVLVIAGGVSTAFHPLPSSRLHVPREYAENTRIARRFVSSGDCVISDSPEIALALPDLSAYSSAGEGPTVDPLAAALLEDGRLPAAAPSLSAYVGAMARCPWFATPQYWSARGRYPGWSDEMQAWFERHHDVVVDAAGMELWRRRAVR